MKASNTLQEDDIKDLVEKHLQVQLAALDRIDKLPKNSRVRASKAASSIQSIQSMRSGCNVVISSVDPSNKDDGEVEQE